MQEVEASALDGLKGKILSFDPFQLFFKNYEFMNQGAVYLSN